MDGILLKKIDVDGATINYHFEARGKLKKLFNSDCLTIIYTTDVSTVPTSLLTVPFVSIMLPVIWLSNTVLWVKELDYTFYEALERIRSAYQRLYYSTPLQGNVVTAKLTENNIAASEKCCLLFGGGIDCHCTYQRIKEKKPTVINIQGWFTDFSKDSHGAQADIDYTRHFASANGIDCEIIKSNFAILINSESFSREFKQFKDSLWHGFQHSMAFISISIPVCFKCGINRIYIASSVPMGEYVMCASHVTTDSEFKFATNGTCIHDGSELTRQDKVHVIVSQQKETGGKYPLKVCSFNDHNCCSCDKCFRSILGIVAEGGDISDFGFNLNEKLKNHFEQLMIKNGHTFNIYGESNLHWRAIRKRMKENYDNILYKDFVDWFLTFDFVKARKNALRHYYIHNFFSILRRKVFGK